MKATDRYITARLRRIEWFVKAGRIEQAQAALRTLTARVKQERYPAKDPLYPWAKRIAAIEKSWIAFGIYKDDPIERDDPEHAQDKAAQHTPGPWEYNGCEDEMENDCIAITSDNRPGYIAGIHCAADAKLDETDQANAEFIVRACNAHDQLLAACKAIVECDSPPQDQGGDWGSTEWLEWVGQAIEQAKEAIAKAEARS